MSSRALRAPPGGGASAAARPAQAQEQYAQNARASACAQHYLIGTDAQSLHLSAYAPGLKRADSERSQSHFDEVDLRNVQSGNCLENGLKEEETLYVSERGVELSLEADGDEDVEDLAERHLRSQQKACGRLHQMYGGTWSTASTRHLPKTWTLPSSSSTDSSS